MGTTKVQLPEYPRSGSKAMSVEEEEEEERAKVSNNNCQKLPPERLFLNIPGVICTVLSPLLFLCYL